MNFSIHSTIGHILTLTLCCLLASVTWAQTPTLKSVVDRTQISIDETLQLTVRYAGSRSGEQPDFSQLETQFKIYSTQQSNQFRSFNGTATSYTDWKMVLAPLSDGRLFIPSFSYAGAISDAIEINVSASAPQPKGSIKDIFVETVIEQDDVYVQEQLLLKYRLYYSVAVDSVEAAPMEIEDAVVESLPNVQYTRKVGNREYRIAEFSYAVYPEKSGSLTIPQQIWDVKIVKAGGSRSFFGSQSRFEISRQRTEEKSITVKAQPASFPKDQPWLPASKLSLEESWSKPTSLFQIGEPITRTLTLKAEGLTAAQLPQISEEVNTATVRSYSDQAEATDNKAHEGISAVRIESAAVVVSGEPADLPAVKVYWWDTSSDSLQIAEVAARSLNLSMPSRAPQAPSSASSPTTQPITDSKSSEEIQALEDAVEDLKTHVLIWQFVCAALLLLCCVIVMLFWLIPRNQRQPNTSNSSDASHREKDAFNALLTASKKSNNKDFRATLLAWAHTYWPRDGIRTLDQLRQKIANEDLSGALQALDSTLYSKEELDKDQAIDRATIINTLKQWRKKQTTSKDKAELAPFYAS